MKKSIIIAKQMLFAVLLLTIVFACKKKEDPAESKMIIKVMVAGTPVGNVHVFTVPFTSDLVTDEYGLATLGGVSPGEYQVYAEKGVYTGKSIVVIGEGDIRNVTVDLNYTGPISFIPEITFVLPDLNHAYTTGDSVIFRVKVSNYKAGSQVEWRSNLDGILGSTPIDASGFSDFSTTSLSKGEHQIMAKAVGNEGYSAMISKYIDMTGPPKVFLYPLEIQGNSALVTWSKFAGDDFEFYQVNCRYNTTPGDPLGNVNTTNWITTQTDTSQVFPLPASFCTAQFYVMAGKSGGHYNVSNFRELKHTLGPYMAGVPVQMLLHPQNNWVYLIFSDRTVLYDYVGQEIITTANTGSLVRRLDLGDNGAGLELYLPDKATIKVLDGNTLMLKKTITFPQDIVSVVSSGLGFLICSINPATADVKPLQFYSLTQQAVISEGGEPNSTYYMKKVPGKNVLVACTRRGYSSELDYFEYSDAGAITLHKDIYSASGGYSPEVMEMSPDGNYFCVGSSAFFRETDQALTSVAYLEDSPEAFDFAFNETGSSTWCCTSGSSLVNEYHYPSGTKSGSFNVYGFPQHMAFRNNNIIIATRAIGSIQSCIEVIPAREK
jgi:hypothetical protein